jgi:hypothetical protein
MSGFGMPFCCFFYVFAFYVFALWGIIGMLDGLIFEQVIHTESVYF